MSDNPINWSMKIKKQLLFAVPVLAMGDSIINFWSSSMEKTYQADRLFKPYGEQIYRLAQKIERKQAITLDEVKALPDGVNQRYGEDITLLFHAVSAHNLQAVDVLFAAGADPTMRTHIDWGYDFIYLMGVSGGEQGIDFINGLIKIYLKYGGDPNIRTPGNKMEPIITRAALFRNIEGMKLLLEAGADFWAENKMGSTAASITAQGPRSDLLHEFIDRGYFYHIPEEALKDFFSALSGYLPRGDEISLQNQKIAIRVLKRNPQYEEDSATQRLFQGPIPWKQILDEPDTY